MARRGGPVVSELAPQPQIAPTSSVPDTGKIARLSEAAVRSGPHEAYELLEHESDDVIVAVLGQLNPAVADQVLWEFPDEHRARVLSAAPEHAREQWLRNH